VKCPHCETDRLYEPAALHSWEAGGRLS
jgi:hypothetical protein